MSAPIPACLIRNGHVTVRLAAMACACLSLAACTFNVNKVQVDTARLDTGKSIGTLQCRYGLAGVVDARPSGDRAGGLGENMLLLEDPSDVISARLQSAGMTQGPAPDAPEVLVEIKRFYLTVNTMAKVPVVVLQARIDQQQPFLVRAQPVSANWNGTENEAYAALANALQGAVTQLVSDLNGRCPAKQPTPT